MKNKQPATAIKQNALLPAVHWSPRAHLTEKRLIAGRSMERSCSFCTIFSMSPHFQRLGKQFGLTTSNRGGENWPARITHLSLSAADWFPIVAPTVLHGLKVLNPSSFICMKTLLPFVFKRGTWWAVLHPGQRKSDSTLSSSQENESTGRLGTRECQWQHTKEFPIWRK